jgi:hypothetical protein
LNARFSRGIFFFFVIFFFFQQHEKPTMKPTTNTHMKQLPAIKLAKPPVAIQRNPTLGSTPLTKTPLWPPNSPTKTLTSWYVLMVHVALVKSSSIFRGDLVLGGK